MPLTDSPSRRYADLYQPALGVVQAFVHIHSALNTIGAHDSHALQHIRAVIFHKAAGCALHHAVEHLVGLCAGNNIRRLIVHAQQQSDHFAHAAAVQVDTLEATAVLPS